MPVARRFNKKSGRMYGASLRKGPHKLWRARSGVGCMLRGMGRSMNRSWVLLGSGKEDCREMKLEWKSPEERLTWCGGCKAEVLTNKMSSDELGRFLVSL